VLRGAAEEVLQVLKDDTSNDPKRKSDVEKLMGPTSDESFARMVAVGKLVTDFKPGGAGDDADDAAGDALDDDIGVAVEFEEEDEETDNEVDEVLEASDVEEEEEGGEEAETAGAGVGVAGRGGRRPAPARRLRTTRSPPPRSTRTGCSARSPPRSATRTQRRASPARPRRRCWRRSGTKGTMSAPARTSSCLCWTTTSSTSSRSYSSRARGWCGAPDSRARRTTRKRRW
jgi:hypothetical protein